MWLKMQQSVPQFGESDRAMLRAVDDLASDLFARIENWTVGQFPKMSMPLNSFGVQPEPDLALDASKAVYEVAA